MSRYIDAEPWESMGASVKFEYPNKCDGTLIGHIMIRDIHTADVAPVIHGRWVHLGGDEWYCSACGFVISTEGSWEKPTKKYCEDCGAKMEGSRFND